MGKPAAIVFDWGDTVMRDFPEFKGPMTLWPRVEAVDGVTEALESLYQDTVCCLASNAGEVDWHDHRMVLSDATVRFPDPVCGYHR